MTKSNNEWVPYDGCSAMDLAKYLDEEILPHVYYDKDVGVFKRTSGGSGVVMGKDCGHKEANGYVRLTIKGKRFLAHRLAWFIVNGPIPEGYVLDHINRDRSDNRIENLRVGTRSQNQYNRKIFSNNKSGVKGVIWSGAMKKWKAEITKDKKVYVLGYSSTIDECKQMIDDNRDRLHREFSYDGL